MSSPPPPPEGKARPTIPLAAQDVQIVDVKPVAEPTERVSPWRSLYTVHHNPCFRHAMLWGIGLGAAMSVHSALRHRSQWKALNTGMLTWGLVSSAAWIMCRKPQYEEKEHMRKAMAAMAAKREAEAAEQAVAQQRLQQGKKQ